MTVGTHLGIAHPAKFALELDRRGTPFGETIADDLDAIAQF